MGNYDYIIWLRVYLATKTFPGKAYGISNGKLLENKEFVKFLGYLGLSSGIKQYRSRVNSYFTFKKQIDNSELEVISMEPVFDFGGVLVKFDTLCDLAWALVNIDYVLQNPIFNEILTSYLFVETIVENEPINIRSNSHERLMFLYAVMTCGQAQIEDWGLPNAPKDLEFAYLEKGIVDKLSKDTLLTLFIDLLEDLRKQTI